jgi:hypothetical protein
VDWVDVELDNLRAAFRWASDRHHIETATAIAAHTALLECSLMQWEPVSWAQELLLAAIEADVRQLPRLLVGAVLSTFIGRRSLVRLEGDIATESSAMLHRNPRQPGATPSHS